MKPSLLLLFAWMIPSIVVSQQTLLLPGLVVEQNSKYLTGQVQYVSEVSIRSGSDATTSDVEGKFHLVFSDREEGETARITALKYGMDLVNRKELEQASILGREEPLRVVMAPAGRLVQAQISYYQIAETAIYRDHDKKIAQLQQTSADQDQVIAELEEEMQKEIHTLTEAIQLLEEQLYKKLELARIYAEEIATVNLDEAQARYIRAFEAFDQGDYEMVLEVLNLKALEKDVADLQEEERRITGLRDRANQRELVLRERRKEIVKENLLAGKVAVAGGQWQAARKYFELAVKADSTSIEALQKLCEFALAQDDSRAALGYAQLLKDQSRSPRDRWQALHYLGLSQMLENQFAKGAAMYEEALAILPSFAPEDSLDQQIAYAMTLTNLGLNMREEHQLGEAVKTLQQALEIRRKLATKDPEKYLPGLFEALGNLGLCYNDLHQVDQMEQVHQEISLVFQTIKAPKPEKIREDYAKSLTNWGNLLLKSNRIAEAIQAYEESLLLYRDLLASNPARNQMTTSTIQFNLGNAYGAVQQYEKAITIHEEALSLRRELARKNQGRDRFLVAHSLNSLGIIYARQQNFEQALEKLEEAAAIYDQADMPEIFLPSKGWVLNNLATTYKKFKQSDKAIGVYQEVIQLFETLRQSNPDLSTYPYSQSIAYGNLALEYMVQWKEEPALSAIAKGIDLLRPLAEAHPEAYEPELANQLSNQVAICLRFGAFSQAKAILKEGIPLSNRLANKDSLAFGDLAVQILLNQAWLDMKEVQTKPRAAKVAEGLEHLQLAERAIQYCPPSAYLESLQPQYDVMKLFFQTADLRELKLIVPAHALGDSIAATGDLSAKISFQKQRIAIFAQALGRYPAAPHLQDSISQSLDSLAGWQLFSGKFADAEASVRRCLEEEQTYVPVHRWLAPALLFQSHHSQARELYLSWKSTPWPGEGNGSFQEVFLADLNRLAAKGFPLPDSIEVQTWLTE